MATTTTTATGDTATIGRRRPWRTGGSATIRIAASPEAVYDRVADVTRRDSTMWGFSIERDADGSVVTHDYRIVRPPVSGWRQLLGVAFPHHRDMRPHLEHTLQALKADLER